MIWVLIIIAVVVIGGLLFWVKSGKKDDEMDLPNSSDESAPEETLEPSESVEAPDEDKGAIEPEAPEAEEESSPDEEKMV